MLNQLLSLAQKLDDSGMHKAAAKIDLLIAKVANDEDQLWNKKPKERPGSDPMNWGLSAIQNSKPFELTDLPDVMRPKPKDDEGFDDTTVKDFEIGQAATFQHNLASDKKFLLEDMAEAISNKLGSRPISILNKTDSIQPYIKLEFREGFVVLSAHSTVSNNDENELQVWLEVNSFFSDKTNQLKFPLDLALGGWVDQATIDTMVERIVDKIESLQNS